MRRLLLPILFSLIIGIIIGVNISKQFSENPINSNKISPGLVRFFTEPILRVADVDLPTYGLTLVDAEPIWSLPEEPSEEFPKGSIHGIKPFNENELVDGMQFISQIDDPSAPANWQIKEIDIDGDGVSEQVMINEFLQTNKPHVIRIVKDGLVVFEFHDNMVNVEEVLGNESWGGDEFQPGFVLTTNMWQDKSGYRVRYVVEEDGTIRPLWQQRHAGLASLRRDEN